jgi:MEMO1 family protein
MVRMRKKIFIILVFLVALTVVLFGDERILVSHLAGTWHSGQQKQLNKDMDNYFNNVKEKNIDDVIALILPHAGYRYSGQTAAFGVKEIIGKKYSRVILLGPSHSYPLKNKIAFPSFNVFRTPMGDVEVDKNFINKLIKVSPYGMINDLAHINEHSLLIQLPMFQKALGDFKLVPIVIGQLDGDAAKKIAEELKGCIDNDTLIVASSDFTHYGARFKYMPFPNDFQVASKLEKLDMGAVKSIEDKNPKDFNNYIAKTGVTICGENPISILLNMLPEDSKATLLHYDTSGKQMNDYDNSVSYVSMAFSGKWNIKTDPNDKNIENESILSDKDKNGLLSLARKSIEFYLKEKKMPTAEMLGVKITPNMEKTMGGFVSLYEFGELRGCIGEITPRRPLYQAVMSQAVNAAVNDYRFPPVVETDVPNLKIEISALTPPHKVDSYKDIVIGKDGMTLTKNGRSAVFLPQVAPEQGWDLDKTLSYLSLKAGLPMNAWKEGADFTVFQAIVFGEEGLKKKE